MQRYINNWSAELAAPLSAEGMELVLPSAEAAKLDFSSGGYYDLTLNGEQGAVEILRVTANQGGTLTISERGLEGTDAQAWAEGAVVFCDITAGGLGGFERLAQVPVLVEYYNEPFCSASYVLSDEDAGRIVVLSGTADFVDVILEDGITHPVGTRFRLATTAPFESLQAYIWTPTAEFIFDSDLSQPSFGGPGKMVTLFKISDTQWLVTGDVYRTQPDNDNGNGNTCE